MEESTDLSEEQITEDVLAKPRIEEKKAVEDTETVPEEAEEYDIDFSVETSKTEQEHAEPTVNVSVETSRPEHTELSLDVDISVEEKKEEIQADVEAELAVQDVSKPIKHDSVDDEFTVQLETDEKYEKDDTSETVDLKTILEAQETIAVPEDEVKPQEETAEESFDIQVPESETLLEEVSVDFIAPADTKKIISQQEITTDLEIETILKPVKMESVEDEFTIEMEEEKSGPAEQMSEEVTLAVEEKELPVTKDTTADASVPAENVDLDVDVSLQPTITTEQTTETELEIQTILKPVKTKSIEDEFNIELGTETQIQPDYEPVSEEITLEVSEQSVEPTTGKNTVSEEITLEMSDQSQAPTTGKDSEDVEVSATMAESPVESSESVEASVDLTRETGEESQSQPGKNILVELVDILDEIFASCAMRRF